MATRPSSPFIILLSIGICSGEGLGGGAVAAWRLGASAGASLEAAESAGHAAHGLAAIASGPSPLRGVGAVGPSGIGGPGPGAAGLFAEEPQDVVVRKGADAVLGCARAPAYAHWAVSWRKDGVALQPDGDHFVVEPSGHLVIRQVARSGRDVGEYRCALQGSKEEGLVLSRAASLHVASLSHAVHGPENITVPITGTARFVCSVDSVPVAKITWQKDGQPLPNDSRYVSLASGVLLISEVHSSDGGSYRCIATNTVLKKSRFSNEAFLHVGMLPVWSPNTFLAQNDVLQVIQGENVSLECSVSGNGVPVWSFEGKDMMTVDPVNNFTLPGLSILKFHDINPSQSGTYKCSVKTALQSHSQLFNVQVLTPVSILEPPKSESHPTAHTVRFSCNVSGIPSPNVTWYKDGVELKADGRVKPSQNRLLISSSIASDTGLYQCMVRNSISENWGIAHLHINSSGIHAVPANLVCQKQGENFVTISWTFSLSAKAFLVNYGPTGTAQEAYTQALSTDLSCTVLGLEPFTNYTFTVRAFLHGASEPGPKLTCQTKESVPETAPEVMLTVVSPSRLNVTWIPLNAEKANGHVTEYKVQWRQLSRSTAKVREVSNDILHYTITDLVPGIKYEVRVLARTSRGWPYPSKEEALEWMYVEMPLKTSEVDLPSQETNSFESQNNSSHPKDLNLEPPHGLEAEPTSPHAINLTWLAPHDVEVRYYSVVVKEAQSSHGFTSEESDVINCTNLWVEIDDLLPNTMYELSLKAYSKNGLSSPFSEKIECRTLQEVPEVVTDISWDYLNNSNLKVMWKRPSSSLRHFNVSLIPLDAFNPIITVLVNGSRANAEVSGVKPSVPYQLIVTGISQGGSGPPSSSVLVFPTPPKVILSKGEHLANVSQDVSVLAMTAISVACVLMLGIVTVIFSIMRRRARMGAHSCLTTRNRARRGSTGDCSPSQRPFQPNGNGSHGQVPLTSFVTPDSNHFRHQLGMRGLDSGTNDGCDSKGLEDSNITLLPPGTAPTPIGASSTYHNVEVKNTDGTITQPCWSGNLLQRHLFNITENPQCESVVNCKTQPPRYDHERSEHNKTEEMEKLLSAKQHTCSESEMEDCGEEVGDPMADTSNVTQTTEVDHSFQDKSNNNDVHNNSVSSTNSSHSGIEDHHSSRSSSFIGEGSDGSNDITEQQLLVTFSSVPLHHLSSKPFLDIPKVSIVGPNG